MAVLLLLWIATILFTLILLTSLFYPEKKDIFFHKISLFQNNLILKSRTLLLHSINSLPILLTKKLSTSHFNFKEKLSVIVAIATILALPSLLIYSTRDQVVLDGYNSSVNLNTSTSSLIASLMQGEQLAPPPPFPPEIFITNEVELAKPDLALNQANRDWNQLQASFRQRLLAVFKIMQEKYGYEMVMIEGYRSSERQNYLSSKGTHVTNARGGESYHQYGLAADAAFYRNGKLIISEKDPWAMRGYQLYGKTAQEAGLIWGGSWKSIQDLGHVELRLRKTQPH